MTAAFSSHDWRDRKVQEWLLLLLRFAVTREPRDQTAVLATADELDSAGIGWRPAAPSFFLRTSNEVCAAILGVGDRHNTAVLQRHIARIDDPRLRRAFQAAVGLRPTSAPRQQDTKGKQRKDRGLWEGLPRKR